METSEEEIFAKELKKVYALYSKPFKVAHTKPDDSTS